jgi:RNA polymerase sigma factor (sigma-70 family)
MAPMDPQAESPPQTEESHVRRLPTRIPKGGAWLQEGTAQLMSGAKSGCAGEFATQRRGKLLAMAMRLCRNAADAEELVQETLYRFLRGFGEVEVLPNDRTCESWLVTTLTNLFYDQCRKQRVQAQGAKDPLLSDEAMARQESTPQPVYDSITQAQFNQALQELSPKARAAFDLHLAGKKYVDIARILGIKPGTARKRLHDARDKLRELLQPYLTPGGH